MVKKFKMSESREYSIEMVGAERYSSMAIYSTYKEAVRIVAHGYFEAGEIKVSFAFPKEGLAELISELETLQQELIKTDAEYAEKLADNG